MSFIVAVDGPAGTGKGTLTQIISRRMNLITIDTGATYRCVTLAMLNNNVQIDDIEGIKELLKTIKIEIKLRKGKQQIFLNGKDVSNEIRTKEVTTLVSPVSSITEVRYAMTELQRSMAEGKRVIMEGRDIGTCVFPKADVKIYLDAAEDERVKRRYKQNIKKKIKMTYKEVQENIRFRDKNDKEKEMGALKQAEDAIYIDTTNMSIGQVANHVQKIIKNKQRDIERNERIYEVREDTMEKKIERKLVNAILTMLYKTFYRVEEKGKENIPIEGAYILCANHVHALDSLGIVVLNKRKVRVIAKYELFKNSFIFWLAHLYDVIPINRNKQDIESMKRSLNVITKENGLLAIFPEGTRKGLEKKEKVKTGAAYMALKTGTPVIPIGIKGTFKPFSKLVFNYGEPIVFEKNRNPDKEVLEETTKNIMENIINLAK
ncbi:MAG: (d)CMP kinase [Clostridia bacterium]|nr:(d)CMP kinase [Clostridia bacterium]